MASSGAQHTWTGFVAGAGMGLFALYVLTSAVPVSMEPGQPARLALGGVGLALWVAGFLLGQRLRRSGRATDAEPGAAADTAGRPGSS